MDPSRYALPGAGPVGDRDSLSDKATIALLERRLMEAEHNVQLWKEQAEEARTEYIKCKSNAKVLQTELENTQKELARVRVIKKDKEVSVIAAAEAAKVNEANDMLAMDYAIAKQLDQQLNIDSRKQGGVMPSDFSDETGRAFRHRSVHSSWSGPVEEQLEKAKDKNHALTKRVQEMEGAAHHWQRAYHQERSHHIRIYNQARALDMEYNSAVKHIHELDEELKTSYKPLYMEDAYADRSLSKMSAFKQVFSTDVFGLQRIAITTGGVQWAAEILFIPNGVLRRTVKEVLEAAPCQEEVSLGGECNGWKHRSWGYVRPLKGTINATCEDLVSQLKSNGPVLNTRAPSTAST
ncbi:hypothetical protein H1R20_g2036, partial [Candolleomyces eurysporus]